MEMLIKEIEYSLQELKELRAQKRASANAYYDLIDSVVEDLNVSIQEEQIKAADDFMFDNVIWDSIDRLMPHSTWEVCQVISANGLSLFFTDPGRIPCDSDNLIGYMQARIFEALQEDVRNSSNIVWYEEEEKEDN